MQSEVALPRGEVVLDEPTLVLPSQATPSGVLHLSNYDHQVLFNLESVYFYPFSGKKTENVANVLKDALSKVLVPYHFMAGRLRMDITNQKMEVDCNRAGALFASASTDYTFADLQDTGTFIGLLGELTLHPQNTASFADVPLLTIQVTRFKCGSFVVGMSRNHALVGGLSGNEFLKNYTSLARGDGLQINPIQGRSHLMARNPPQPKFEHIEYMKADQLPEDEYFTTANMTDNLELTGNFGPHMYRWKTFNFSQELVNSFKAKAMEDSSSALHNQCTSFEALASKVWQGRTAALNRDPDWLSSLVFVFDCRKVIHPPLPVGYTGNALSLGCARLPAKQLLESPLSFCVKQMQEAKARMTNEYVRSAIDWLEVNKGIPAVNGGIYLSSWTKFNFLDVDFGWGHPVQTMFIPSKRSKDCVVFIPNKNGGGLDVCLEMDNAAAHKFQHFTGGVLKWPPPSSPAPPPPPSIATRRRAFTANYFAAPATGRAFSTSSNSSAPALNSLVPSFNSSSLLIRCCRYLIRKNGRI